MTWEKPEVSEIKMDAEIGSYQLDEDGPHGPYFVASSAKGAREGETTGPRDRD